MTTMVPSPWRRGLGVMLLMGVCGWLVGCSDEAKEEAGAPELSPPPLVSIQLPESGYLAIQREPLALYDTSTEDDETLFRARHVLATACMHDRGYVTFNGEGVDIVSVPDAKKNITLPAGPWGYLGAQNAAVNGFHDVESSTADRPKTVGMPREQLTAYRECIHRQEGRLSLTKVKGRDLAKSLGEASRAATAKDSRVVGAREEWSRCMKDSGFAETDPQAIAGRNWRATPRPDTEEIQLALADERCTQQSKLAETYFAILWGYQRQLIDANAAALTEYQREIKARVAEATRIVANNGTAS